MGKFGNYSHLRSTIEIGSTGKKRKIREILVELEGIGGFDRENMEIKGILGVELFEYSELVEFSENLPRGSASFLTILNLRKKLTNKFIHGIINYKLNKRGCQEWKKYFLS